MFPTGSKLFLGLTAAAGAGFVLYGFLQEWGSLGVVGLGSAVVALAFLAGVSLSTRDADVSAMDDTAVATAPAGQPAPRSSGWPLVGAIGAGLLVVGLVTDKRWFVAGLAALLIATVEWMVMGWADRASADGAYNRAVRGRILQPLEMPLLGAVGLALLIFSFSRIMLKAETDLGPALFVAAAGLILVFGFIFAARRRPSRAVMASLCVVGAVGIVGPGIWAAAEGERPELAHEAEHFEEERQACGPEVNAADEDASGALAAKSSIAAEVVLHEDGTLTVTEDGRPTNTLFVARNNVTNVLFKNESGEEEHRRLAARFIVTDSSGAPALRTVCTNAIGDDKVQLLTFQIPKPSSIAPAGSEFVLAVPGVPTATIPIVVP